MAARLSLLPAYSDFPLDRAPHLRTNEEAGRLLEQPSTRLILCNSGSVLCRVAGSSNGGGRDEYTPVCAPASAFKALLKGRLPLVFLGQDSAQHAHFAAEVEERTDVAEKCVSTLGTSGGDVGEDVSQGQGRVEWLAVRNEGARLSSQGSALAATAVGMLSWHESTGYSPLSGKVARSEKAGWAKRGSADERALYARIEPAVIVHATCGEYVLLGRNNRWSEGRYSALAGFVEVGETLEQCCGREVLEESNVKIDQESIVYVESQPWPFPSSLMIAFTATAAPLPATKDSSELLTTSAARNAFVEARITSEEVARYLCSGRPTINTQTSELADVRWVHWQWLAHNQGWLEGVAANDVTPFNIPGPTSLAHRMMRQWCKEKETEWEGAAVPDCVIDSGTFKYVLLRVSDGNRSKLIVRGDRCSGYHNDVLQKAKAEIRSRTSLWLEECGGGRIEHRPPDGVVQVYGFSMAFGCAVHEISAEIICSAFPFYERGAVTVSYDGY